MGTSPRPDVAPSTVGPARCSNAVASGARRSRPPRSPRHFLLAEEGEKAFRYLLDAGAAARRPGLTATALVHLNKAQARLPPATPPEVRYRLWELLGRANGATRADGPGLRMLPGGGRTGPRRRLARGRADRDRRHASAKRRPRPVRVVLRQAAQRNPLLADALAPRPGPVAGRRGPAGAEAAGPRPRRPTRSDSGSPFRPISTSAASHLQRSTTSTPSGLCRVAGPGEEDGRPRRTRPRVRPVRPAVRHPLGPAGQTRLLAAERHSEDCRSPVSRAVALCSIGIAYYLAGDLYRAVDLVCGVRPMLERHSHWHQLCLYFLRRSYVYLGRFDEALAVSRAMAAFGEQTGNSNFRGGGAFGIATVLCTPGSTLRRSPGAGCARDEPRRWARRSSARLR